MTSRIYEQYRSRVYSFILRHVRDSATAEDLVQDVFIQFIAKPVETNQMLGYLCGIAKHLICKRRHPMSTLTSEPVTNNTADLDYALDMLSAQEFEAVWLAYAEQWSAKAIAKKLGISAKAAGKLTKQTLKKLQKNLPIDTVAG